MIIWYQNIEKDSKFISNQYQKNISRLKYQDLIITECFKNLSKVVILRRVFFAQKNSKELFFSRFLVSVDLLGGK